MENIFMTKSGIVRHLTIHYGPGLSANPTDHRESIFWARVIDAISRPRINTWLKVDYWTDSPSKNHPLLSDYTTPNFDFAPLPTDRLISAEILPAPYPVELDDSNAPGAGFSFEAHVFRLYIKNESKSYIPSTCTRVHLLPETGCLELLG
jgi:hypothetical protein